MFLLISSGAVHFDLGPIQLGKNIAPAPTATVSLNAPTPTVAGAAVATAAVTTTDQQASSTTHVVGQPWEQNGVSLVLDKIDIRTSDNSGPGAVMAAFRFFNKTGQQILVPIDWSKIHLEDSEGNAYVDWQGGGTDSVTVQPLGTYDFMRYYGLQRSDNSRVPVDAQYVDVVVDAFSRVQSARWRYPINADLVQMATPDPASVKALNGTWEQGGWALTVDRVDIPSQANGGIPAIHVYFTLQNKTGTRRLTELDFNQIYLLDSFGQRYSDWQGGEIQSRSLNDGESWDFDRYYSLMAQTTTYMPSGADFIVVTVDQAAGITNKEWRIDIAH